MAAEVIQGQGQDVRGLTWWGDAEGFVTSLRRNDSNPDVITHSYCNNNPPNPPANCAGVNGTTPPRAHSGLRCTQSPHRRRGEHCSLRRQL